MEKQVWLLSYMVVITDPIAFSFSDSPRWDVQWPVQTEEPRPGPPVRDREPGRLHRRSAEQSRQDGLQDPQRKPTDEKA